MTTTALVSPELAERMQRLLAFVYGPEAAPAIFERVQQLIDRYAALRQRSPGTAPAERLTERDTILITYGDQVRGAPGEHLKALKTFLARHLSSVFSTVHILPFYPYTSDDGFSVVDYTAVDPALGTWADVDAISRDVKIMFDAVINHISASSTWVQGFLTGDPAYKDYAIVVDPTADLSGVTRPRTLPLLTEFESVAGPRWLWTTFSPDQIDLNYANPDVLLAVLNVLLFYVEHNAALIRLDAIGYLWKQIGTSCIHLPQTHAMVQLIRAVLDAVAPDTLLVTETNVPHKDNISYFGDGRDEAQMVYQFPLVPLTLHALLSGDASYLTNWATTLTPPSDTTTFFNFLASHDGIGLVPAYNMIGDTGVRMLVETTLRHGGQVSYKNNPDGSQSPYELNITYFDALSDPANTQEPPVRKIDRFMAAQAIMLAMQGVPGIYFLSLIGAHSWQEGYAETKRTRTLNRQKFSAASLSAMIGDLASHEAQVFARYTRLLSIRRGQSAFHPNAPQQILTLHPSVYALLRTARDGQALIVALTNVSDAPQQITLHATELGLTGSLRDLITNASFAPDSAIFTINLAPYQVMWLRS